MTGDRDQSWLADADGSRPDPGLARSLLVSVGMLLTIAILPIGLIAVSQVRQAQERTKASYLDELKTQTARAAQPERDAIIAAFGLAKGLASSVALLDLDEVDCSRIMEQSLFSVPDLQFVGFIRDGGISTCNNQYRRLDFSDSPVARALFENPQPHVAFNPAGSATGQPVMIVNQPVTDAEDQFTGFIAMSLMATSMTEAREVHAIPAALDLITFNADGEVLTADMTDQPLGDVLPHNVNLVTLGEIAPRSFEATTRNGVTRYFSVVPIYPGEAYALASWNPENAFMAAGSVERTTLLFTFAMWLAGLLMALGALYFLAVRPLSSLGRRMRTFARHRRLLPQDTREPASRELHVLNRAFGQMARKIIRDEADLENALYERDVLLREVHHRVKNNLQLIGSILNMELRRTQAPDVRQNLIRLQGRLGGLANVYRCLYESDSTSEVRIDTLLDPLLRQLAQSHAGSGRNPRLTVALAPVTLVPDQAAQLALLCVEAVSNALDHHAVNASGESYISVRIDDAGDGWIDLEVANSCDAESGNDPPAANLGAQLIDAFATQLGGTVRRDGDDGRYALTVRFRRAAFEPDPDDRTKPGTSALLAR